MENWTVYWQDVLAVVAGLFLMGTYAVATGDLTVGSGWLIYVCGALVAMFAASGFQQQAPIFSWAAAIFAVIAVASLFVTRLEPSAVLVVCIAAGGAVSAVASMWSALAKRSAT